MPKGVQPIIEEVEIQDIPTVDSGSHKAFHDLKHKGRLSAAPDPDAYGGLAGNRSDVGSAGYSCRQSYVLEVENDLFENFEHSRIPVLKNFDIKVNRNFL